MNLLYSEIVERLGKIGYWFGELPVNKVWNCRIVSKDNVVLLVNDELKVLKRG